MFLHSVRSSFNETSHTAIFESPGSTPPIVNYIQRWHVPKSVMGVYPSENLIRMPLHLLNSKQDCRESQSFRKMTDRVWLIAPVRVFVALTIQSTNSCQPVCRNAADVRSFKILIDSIIQGNNTQNVRIAALSYYRLQNVSFLVL